MRLGHDQYEVYIDKKTFGESAPDAWVKVPEMAILYEHDNPTGRAVVCWYQNRIICLVKASET